MKIGFIGTGNMGGAILKGYSKKAASSGSEILAFDADPAKLMEIAEKYRVYPAKSPGLLVAGSDIVILGLKPDIFEKVMPEISEAYTDDKLVVSMAAGVSISFIEKYLGQKAKVVRIMPNTPALIGQGMTAVAKNVNVDDELFSTVMDIFDSTGKAEEVTEDLMDCVTALSGSSPAYAYMFIEALVSAAEKNGMERAKGTVFAAQAMLGAAKMVLETKESPERLRENVCSPGGTTIEAVQVLKKRDMAGVIEEAFSAALNKSKVMTK